MDWGSFPLVKKLAYEVNHFSPSRTEVTAKWVCTCSPPLCLWLRRSGSVPVLPLYVFMACTRTSLYFIKYKSNAKIQGTLKSEIIFPLWDLRFWRQWQFGSAKANGNVRCHKANPYVETVLQWLNPNHNMETISFDFVKCSQHWNTWVEVTNLNFIYTFSSTIFENEMSLTCHIKYM